MSSDLLPTQKGAIEIREPGLLFPRLKLVPLVVSFLADAKIVEAAGMFDENLSIMEDFEWVVRLKCNARRIVKIPDIVYVQIQTEDSLTKRYLSAFDQRIMAEARMLRTVLPYWKDEIAGRRMVRRRLVRLAYRSAKAYSIRWCARSATLLVSSMLPRSIASALINRMAASPVCSIWRY